LWRNGAFEGAFDLSPSRLTETDFRWPTVCTCYRQCLYALHGRCPPPLVRASNTARIPTGRWLSDGRRRGGLSPSRVLVGVSRRINASTYDGLRQSARTGRLPTSPPTSISSSRLWHRVSTTKGLPGPEKCQITPLRQKIKK